MEDGFEEHLDTLWIDNPLAGLLYHKDWVLKWKEELIQDTKIGTTDINRTLERVEGLVKVLDRCEEVLRDVGY